MSTAYNNLLLWCETHHYILENKEEFIEEFNIQKFSTVLNLVCEKNHKIKITHGSWTNAKTKFKKEGNVTLCVECKKNSDFENKKQEVLEKNGHSVISNAEDDEIIYSCGNCSEQHKISDIKILLRKTRGEFCPHCINNKYKLDYEKIIAIVEKHGMKLITLPTEYVNNKNILVLCVCLNQWKTSLNDINRNRKCSNCKLERTSETNLLRYGCENVFENEEIKKKIKDTCLEKYGVEHHRQLPEIQKKAENTVLEKYGVKWAFTADYVYEKIKQTHLLNYGCEYPFMSPDILDKIKKKMLEKYGSEYYVTSNDCKNKMLEKYGCEYYVTSGDAKDKMLEKYGSEYFINSEECKKMMLEKYGSEYAMQCPELFRKAAATCFRRREYISEAKETTWMVLGYEDRCLKELEKGKDCGKIYAGEDIEIPHFEYFLDDKKHIYFPDIFIPTQNRIIEVKSVWTYNKETKKNLHKANCVSEKYIFELWIYNAKELVVFLTVDKQKIVMNSNDLFVLGEPFDV